MSDSVAPVVVDINLLPRSRRPAEVSPRAVIVGLAIAAAVVALAPLSLRASEAKDRAAASERRADDAEAQVRALQVDLTRVRALRIEIDGLRAEQAAIEGQLAAFRGGSRPLGDDLLALWEVAASRSGVQLTQVSGAVGGLVVSGNAPGPLEAIAYGEALGEEGKFARARLVSFTPSGGAGRFTLEVTR
jgi:hypothetical protein